MPIPKITAILIGTSVLGTVALKADSAFIQLAMIPFAHWNGIMETAIRFVGFQFLHGSLLHLLGNAFFLAYFGSGLERTMGERRFAVFFGTSTLFVGICLAAFSSGPTIGISGFAMAILSYVAMKLREARNEEYKWALLLLAMNVGLGMFGNISLVGHAAGAVAWILWYSAEWLTKKKRYV